MNDHDHDRAVQRIEDLRRDYCPEDDPEWSEREAAREARERYEASEPWKCPSYWEGGDGQEG